MSISTRVSEFLKSKDIPYQAINHTPSHSSVGSALAAHVPMNKVAKAVVLEDHEGHRMMAILPTDNKINIGKLNETFCANFHLMKESEVARLFSDCETGAVPPFGDAYHMKTIVDEELLEQDKIYLEAGDHETLLEMDKDSFNKLVEQDARGHFSNKWSY